MAPSYAIDGFAYVLFFFTLDKPSFVGTLFQFVPGANRSKNRWIFLNSFDHTVSADLLEQVGDLWKALMELLMAPRRDRTFLPQRVFIQLLLDREPTGFS